MTEELPDVTVNHQMFFDHYQKYVAGERRAGSEANGNSALNAVCWMRYGCPPKSIAQLFLNRKKEKTCN